MAASVDLETNHGLYRLEGRPGDDIKSVLDRFSIPLSSVWTFVVDTLAELSDVRQARRVRFVPADTKVESPELDGKILHARVTRNINLPGLLGMDAQFVRSVPGATTEWTFPTSEDGAFKRIRSQLTAEECSDFVKQSVAEVVRAWPADLRHDVVVGTSGGGDSNVLLGALMSVSEIQRFRVVPTMMLGIPDWDTQVDNARQMCSSVGLELRVIDADETARLAGVASLSDLRHDFRTTYPDADLEFLGTWLLRKVLGASAHGQDIDCVATGANREDVIAEGIARIVRGKPPLPAPFRRIGDVNFVYPMYQVPKKIGDGAFPTFSVENYEARNPSFSPGRTVFYYLAYYLADLAPGVDVDLLNGLCALGNSMPEQFELSESIADYVVKDSPTVERLATWKAFLDRHRPTAAGAAPDCGN